MTGFIFILTTLWNICTSTWMRKVILNLNALRYFYKTVLSGRLAESPKSILYPVVQSLTCTLFSNIYHKFQLTDVFNTVKVLSFIGNFDLQAIKLRS